MDTSEPTLTTEIDRGRGDSPFNAASIDLKEEVMHTEVPELDRLPVVPGPTKKKLTDQQCVNYRAHRESLIRWMLVVGKNPSKGKGYAFTTTQKRCHHTDLFYRWVWEQIGQYTTAVTQEHADKYIQHLMFRDIGDSNRQNVAKSLKMLFRWRAWMFDEDTADWESPIDFSEGDTTSTPRDYLTKPERRLIREAALEYGRVPHYCSLTPDERAEWKRVLARRYGMPADEVNREVFERANGWKIPSLVWTSLDAGLRPMEVERASTQWVDEENNVLRIPTDDSVKNFDYWRVSVRNDTARALALWQEERALIDKYTDTDELWLTRHRNPYQSTSLADLLRQLCEIANIEYADRSMTWYTIRHSVGTYMTREEGLAATKDQLRHHSVKTTMKYDQAPIEDRREALEKIG